LLIFTEKTPNPDALKFLPHVRLTDGAAVACDRGDAAAAPLAARLFGIGSVRHVLIAEDFVTVTRDAAGASWDALKIEVIAAIADHLSAGLAAVAAMPAPGTEACDQVESEIRQVLGLYVRPGVARDGGDVLFDRFDAETGVLWIRMHGACGGCPSSRLTLKAGVEQIVRRYVPEVVRVEEAATHEAAEPTEGRLKRWADRLRGVRADGDQKRPVFSYRGEPIEGR
jgi:Fe-S cluster biogenesis protein NfuA